MDENQEQGIVPARTGEIYAAAVPEAEGAAVNPVDLVLNRMHGRWLWFAILGLVLAPVGAAAGYLLTPLKFSSQGYVSIRAQLETNTLQTQETSRLTDYATFVAEQAVLIRSDRVLEEAAKDSRMLPFADRVADRGIAELAEGLMVNPLKGTAFITVTKISSDPAYSAALVNSVLDAYMRIAGPGAETSHTKKLNANREQLAQVRREIEQRQNELTELVRRSPYGHREFGAVIGQRVDTIRTLDDQLAMIDEAISRIRASRPAGEQEPPADAVIQPRLQDLVRVDPTIADTRRGIDQQKLRIELARENFKPGHPALQKAERELDFLQRQLVLQVDAAKEAWSSELNVSPRYGELKERRTVLESERERRRGEIDDLNEQLAKSEQIRRRLEQLGQDESLYQGRVKELTTEEETIRRGRVSIAQYGVARGIPDRDNRIVIAGVGAGGAFGFSFAVFFLWGTLDRRTFGSRQLALGSDRLLLAGTLPDMDEVAEDPDVTDLATNCVHRIRTRIESRRTPGDGYAIMVSSPFQGDGKTTLAVSLGWSYAESGHRTLLVDADFVGQALSHQFESLDTPGLREALQGADPQTLIRPLGSPYLSLLSVGRDRNFGASRLNPASLRKLLRTLRDRYDMILIDTGPMTASIEALPVAGACDGVILSLRRGRSRTSLNDCIRDIQGSGSQYLGVVLNRAERADCIRYGSVSRMSASVSRTLEGAPERPPAHPLLVALQGQGESQNRDRPAGED